MLFSDQSLNSHSQVLGAFFSDRGLLDTLCKATGTTPGITLIGQYPCNGANVVSKTMFLVRQLPSTAQSYLAAIHPYSGAYPNEIWPFNIFCFMVFSTCFILVHPRLYLRVRPWLWLLTSLIGTVSPVVGLLTHPHAPPGTYWSTGFPLMGVILHTQRILCRVS